MCAGSVVVRAVGAVQHSLSSSPAPPALLPCIRLDRSLPREVVDLAHSASREASRLVDPTAPNF